MAKKKCLRKQGSEELERLRERVARLESERAEYRAYERQRGILARLSQRLAAVTSERSLMEAVCEETDELLGWDFCLLAHRPPEQDSVRIVSFVDTADGRRQVFPGGQQTPGFFSKPAQQVLRGKSLLINRTPDRAGPLMHPVGTGRLSASLMFSPVRCAKRTIGFLTIQSYTPGRYGKADLRLLGHIADSIAPAFERVYAEDALRKAHEELEIRVRQRTAELKSTNQHLRRETRERKAALEAVQESEARFRAVTENSLSGVYIFGSGRFLYANSAMGLMFGMPSEELTRVADPVEFVHPDDRPIVREHIRRQLSGENDRAQYRFRLLQKTGQLVYCEVLGRFVEYEGKPVIVGNMLDITDRIHNERARRKSERSLRQLTIEMDRRLESERARIARELHDDLGQVLTALNMNLAWLDKRTADHTASLRARVAESIAYVRQMTGLIRSLCKSLHPVVLDHHGLVEAIRSQVADFEQYSRISCELSIRPADLELDKPLAIATFRILQEALTNVARHSRAERCCVSLSLENQQLTIIVRDEGVGAPLARLSGTKSLGILGMKERATAMGGVFRIDNAKSGGIQVTARLPLCPTERNGNGKATVRPRRAAASKPTGTARIRRK